jgi:hypothetical protein
LCFYGCPLVSPLSYEEKRRVTALVCFNSNTLSSIIKRDVIQFTGFSKFRVHLGKFQSDKLPIQNGLKQGEALSPLLFNFALEWDIRRVQDNHKGLKA